MNDFDLQQQADLLRNSTETFLKQMEIKATEISDREQQLNVGNFLYPIHDS
jgi:hypothetical protein